jgi:hypothetical protein
MLYINLCSFENRSFDKTVVFLEFLQLHSISLIFSKQWFHTFLLENPNFLILWFLKITIWPNFPGVRSKKKQLSGVMNLYQMLWGV